MEVFSGKTARTIRQDFYAKAFMMTLCATLAYPIEDRVRKEHESNKDHHPRQINRTNALALCKEVWTSLWIKDGLIIRASNAMDAILPKTCELIRPGRKLSRKHRPKKKPAMEYKQL